MKVLTLGEPLLHKQSALVGEFDQGIRDFSQAMFEVMEREKGIGLAAVQVGQLLRLFITHVPQDEPRVFINPEITETSLAEVEYEEGCLSIPGINADVIRPASVKVQAWDETGKVFSLAADGLLARTIQHEIDHLNGKLFIDRINPKKRSRLLKHYKGQKLPA
jgi:peptide deformylase